ncbi:dihydroorotate dehydrogenase electron transfer subunit [Caloramator quimbayensis]|uniref:Dihydroorotate dehydrogenase B (NAD(+)), electron transfer subunit n=1 Tax=Caloramator quimbayensis TaxID=1147123 RepID=A0A1T4X7J6_9CLOT|nr:dihydroorotate dehydrogenase electron transfer subunit [Caloramator quimbayensis]SKA85045.1 dihydroorotate dehydrogenase electron transfer subunit [Caloramator quimbayensis]
MQLSYKSCKVAENINLSEDIYKLKVEGDYDIKAGQFFMIKSLNEEPILPRPISVHDFEEGYVSFLYQKKGRGTSIMAKLNVNDEIKLTGPLGNGFDAENIKGKIAVVAGGIGIAPMLYTVKSLKNCDIDLYVGFKDEVYEVDEFKKFVSNIYIATESGKYGYKGYVTDIFSPFEYNAVLCCGPEVMMEKVVKVCRDYATPIFVSMEKHMACGIGACLGCTCETKDGNKRVCKDGPVFYGRDVFINA